MVKKTISVGVDEKLFKSIEKRAERNHLSMQEQIKDIVVRSMSGWGKDSSSNRLDPHLSKMVKIFSKKRTGPKPGKKKK